MKVKVISLPYIFQVLYVLCFTRPRYQVSVYRTIGLLVSVSTTSDASNQEPVEISEITGQFEKVQVGDGSNVIYRKGILFVPRREITYVPGF